MFVVLTRCIIVLPGKFSMAKSKTKIKMKIKGYLWDLFGRSCACKYNIIIKHEKPNTKTKPK